MIRSVPTLYSDADMLVVDKPAGVLSVPDRYDPDAPVVSDLLFPKDDGPLAGGTRGEGHGREGSPGKALFVVHRLDKDTSGVLLFARSAESHKALSASFESREVTKVYHAIVRGEPSWAETHCDYPLKPDGDKLHRTVIDAGRGKASATDFRVLATFGNYSLVEARPRTGRTHQIRVHLAALGHPIVADPLYGDGKPLFLSSFKRKWRGDEYAERPLLSRSALHALSLELPRPGTGEALRFEAPYPKDFRAVVAQLEKLR